MTELTPYRSATDSILSARRIVIKVGSALLLDNASAIATTWLSGLAADIATLRAKGLDIAIVTSGAVGLGRAQLGMKGHLRLEEKQAAAAAGQILLMQAWQSALVQLGLTTAQILLTLADTENRRRYLNARATIMTLFGRGAIPIINENDTTATDEIRYGDNDRLAAHVAQMCACDVLIMLTDIDGLYNRNPRVAANAKHLGTIEAITSEISAMAEGPNTSRGIGTGGMRTKIEAAKIANAAGCSVIIAKGDVNHPLSALLNGARSTLFKPNASPEKARRAWMTGRLNPTGKIHIDAGAVKALKSGASLLPAGITKVEKLFEKGDVVEIFHPDGSLLGRGLCAYDCRDLSAIMGLKSPEIEIELGFSRAAAIHRDDLALDTDI